MAAPVPGQMEPVPEPEEEDGDEGISSTSHPLHPLARLDDGQLPPAPKSHENVILITAQCDSAKI